MNTPANSAPTLSWTLELGYLLDGADPDSTVSGSTVDFRVDYRDSDGDLPVTVELWVYLDANGVYGDGE